MPRSAYGKILGTGLLLMGLLFLPGCPLEDKSPSTIPLTTPYQAVLLDNGQFFFGKLDQSLPDYLLLTDVYYITSVRDPNTKEVKNVLLKRGKEWHSPDRMYLTRQHVVAIEPVAPNSKIADLIQKEQGTQKPK